VPLAAVAVFAPIVLDEDAAVTELEHDIGD
jgi:hypothetical protein